MRNEYASSGGYRLQLKSIQAATFESAIAVYSTGFELNSRGGSRVNQDRREIRHEFLNSHRQAYLYLLTDRRYNWRRTASNWSDSGQTNSDAKAVTLGFVQIWIPRLWHCV